MKVQKVDWWQQSLELQEIAKQRDRVAVKHNNLIQKARFDLSATQQKIMLLLISKIKPEDEDFKEYELDIKEFCDICGIDRKSGKNYKKIKEVIAELEDKARWIEFDEDTETLVRWIYEPSIKKNSGVIRVQLSKALKPYLLKLRKDMGGTGHNTPIMMLYALNMKSQYSIRIYEILRSYANMEQPIILSVEDLQKALVAEHYEYKHFKQKVLDVALGSSTIDKAKKKKKGEINGRTDIIVAWKPFKYNSRSYNQIEFHITIKEQLELLQVWDDLHKELDGQMKLTGVE